MNRKSWLGISLGLNLVLAATLVLFLRHSESSRPKTVVQKESVTRADILETDPNKSRVNEAAGRKPEFPDWRAWIDQLRAAGVPNRVIARVVQADFDDRWQKRQEEYQRRFDQGDLDFDAF